MPNDLYWLKLSAAKDLDSFCSVYGVSAQALKVSRCIGGSEREVASHTIPAGTIRAPLNTIPGVARVSQPVDSFGGRRQEDLSQLKMRVAERLRHKNRAVMPWDYERLVLERFPEVFKVKCFSTMSSNEERPRPGSVLLVVVPKKKECSDGLGFDPMLNAVELNRIRAFVRNHASPFVTVEVRNPVYEQIQVRCSIVLTKQAEVRSGYYLARLNQAVVDYISPWCGIGYKARFGWCIRRTDIESYIRNLEYVDFVTRFSMLHISEDRSGSYALGDTVRLASGVLPDGERETVDEIRPHYPWSLAIPVREHHIETGSSLRSVAAKATGIDQLKVGQTFIIGA
jgi:Baseplate J-like protein